MAGGAGAASAPGAAASWSVPQAASVQRAAPVSYSRFEKIDYDKLLDSDESDDGSAFAHAASFLTGGEGDAEGPTAAHTRGARTGCEQGEH